MNSSCRNSIFRIFFLGAVLLFSSPALEAQRGALVVPQNLGELVDEAETIVVGQVVSARAEKHPEFENLNTVVVTLLVKEVWKGSAGPAFTFRQYVWDFRDAQSVLGYRKGGEYLLLLIKPSEHGLSSPAGLEQGRFRLLRDRQGNRLAVNGSGNTGLFRGLTRQLREKGIELSSGPAALVARHERGPIPLDELRALVKQLAGRD